MSDENPAADVLITPRRIEWICASIRQGCYDHVAVTRDGITRVTFRNWTKRGQAEADRRALTGSTDPPSNRRGLMRA